MEKYNNKVTVKQIVILLFTVPMLIIPIVNLFGSEGILSWHIQQKEFYLSGFQCIAISIVTFILSYYRKDIADKLVIGMALVFMIMQGVVIPYLTVYLYFEIICYIGYTINIHATEKDDLILNFMTGFATWGACAIICSLLKFGTINNLRIMTIFLVLVLGLLCKKKYHTMIERFSKYVRDNSDKRINLYLIIVMVLISLILAAKTNLGQDFDSLWYMLKPEYMLVGETSFYDYLGYAAFVYYYPKLVELFFLPISGLGDYSFILIGNVFVYNLFLVLMYKIMKSLCAKYKEHVILLFVILMCSLPSLISIVPTAKGDTFGVFFVMTAIYCFIEFLKEKKMYLIGVMVIALFFCTGTKLTFILWGGIVGIVLCMYLIIWYTSHKAEVICKIPNSYNLLFFFSGLFYIGGIHYRTYRLTGYPIYPLFLGLWNALGFKAAPYMKEVSNEMSTTFDGEILNRIYEFFWNPNELLLTVMCWPTNIVLILFGYACILLIGKRVIGDNTLKGLIIISVIELLFAIYFLLGSYADGNYFFTPFLIISITIFYGLYLNQDNIKEHLNSRFLSIILSMMIIMILPLSFVTNWTWQVGIKPFSTSVIGDNFSDYKADDNTLKGLGCYNIAKYIEENFGNRRVIVSGSVNVIKGAVEYATSVFSDRWTSEAIIENGYDSFKEYVQYANIQGFVLLDNDETLYKEYVLRVINEVNCEMVMEDEQATFYVVSY